MRFTYVVSQFPARSETFIAREMQALADAGHAVEIMRMRWSDTGTGELVPGANVSPILLRPDQALRGLLWAMLERGVVFREMMRSVWDLEASAGLKMRLVGVAVAACAAGVRVHRQSVDHIRAHFLDMEAVGAYWLAQLLDTPFSITAQTTTRRLPDAFVRSILDAASLRVSTTAATHRFLTEACPGQPVRMIRSGLSLGALPERPRRGSGSPFQVLAVGRLVPKKGFGVLLNACARLQQRGAVAVQCTVIGDGPLRQALEQQARRLGLQQSVTVRGALPFRSVQAAYAEADLLVMPSRRDPDTGDVDGLPNVLIEAAAARLPVLATRVGGIEDLVQPGRTGALVEPGDADALAQEIQRIATSYDEALRHAATAYQYVHAHFDLEEQVRQLVEAIQNAGETTPTLS